MEREEGERRESKNLMVEDAPSAVMGPAIVSLLPGELVAVGFNTKIGREGRSDVLVRVVGDASLGWVEAAYHWGACLDAIVLHTKKNLSSTLTHTYQCSPVNFDQALRMPTHGPWGGDSLLYNYFQGR